MPQEPSRGGLDDAAEEEVKTFHTEGDGEERVIENHGPASVHQDSYGFANPDDLNDVKSSLVIEGDPSSLKGGNAQRNKRLNGSKTYNSSEDGHSKKIRTASAQEAASEKVDYPRFPPFSNIAFFPGNYPSNGAVLSGPGGSKVPMVHPMPPYPSSLAHLMYSSERFPPGTPPPAHLPTSVEIDSKTGILRPRHSTLDLPSYHPLSPSAINQLPHHLDIYPLSSQPFYPTIRSPYPTNLLMNSSAISRLAPSTHPSNYRGIPHSPQTSPASQHHDTQQQSNDRETNSEKNKKKDPPKVHIKKPLNAFMLYMKEMRASVVKECTLKESAAINQILGRRWHALSREEQAKYYELARKERQLHMQLYPGWSARDNYATACRRRKKRKDKSQGDASDPSTPKKCRARFGVDQQDFWCKPCRRKKKCIRFIQDENGMRHSGDDDEDDSDYSGDEGSDDKDGSSPPSKKQCLNPPGPDGGEELPDRTPQEKPRVPSPSQIQGRPEKKEGAVKQLSASSALSVSSLTSQPVRSLLPSSSGLSSNSISGHPRSPATMIPHSSGHPRSPAAIMPHGSPTLIPLPHPATPSHPGVSGVTSSFMMFPPHSPLVSYSSPSSSFPEVYRGAHLVPPPPSLIPIPQFPGGHPSMPRHPLRLSSSEAPQDLSMKSGAVTA